MIKKIPGRQRDLRFLTFCLILVSAIVSFLQAESVRPDQLLQSFTFRNIGPFRAGSWVTCFAVPDYPEQAHLYTFYVGTRNGGIWKTTNNGTTWSGAITGCSAFAVYIQPSLSVKYDVLGEYRKRYL